MTTKDQRDREDYRAGSSDLCDERREHGSEHGRGFQRREGERERKREREEGRRARERDAAE